MGKYQLLQNQYNANGIKLNYYEIENDLPILIMIHAQGTNALSFENTFKELSKHYHIYTVDCPGHGLSDRDKSKYNIVDIGNAFVDFIDNFIKKPVYVVGHSSGGLITAYIGANSKFCNGLILEDPPFFSCQGDRRFKTFNYLDLSTVCHNYLETKSSEDFALYYFTNQLMWIFFPEKSREKIKTKLIASAAKYRCKHPDRPLKVPFFPKSALLAYQGMNEYDPYFGEAFYEDSFNAGIPHDTILKKITCKTLLMKAKTNYSDEQVLLAAMSEDDAKLVSELIPDCKVEYFDCGHGVHIEKEKDFINAIIEFGK